MYIEDGEFEGWYLDGEKVTSIPTGSTGNITLVANWKVANRYEISDADAEALNALYADSNNTVATYIVDQSLSSAAYSVRNVNNEYVLKNNNLTSGFNGVKYTLGENLFTTITDALAVANAGDVIYVFGGTYTETITVNTTDITLAGPNYGIHGTATRNTEATIQGTITVSSNGLELNGLAFTGTSTAVVANANIEGLTLANLNVNTAYTHIAGGAGQGYNNNFEFYAFLWSNSSVEATNVIVEDSLFYTGINIQWVPISIYNANNLTIDNNRIETIGDLGYVLSLTSPKGVVEFTDNTVIWSSGGYTIRVDDATETTQFVMRDNHFSDATGRLNEIMVNNAQELQFIGNYVKNLEANSTSATNYFDLNFTGCSQVYIKYNIFEGDYASFTYDTSVSTEFSNNYFTDLTYTKEELEKDYLSNKEYNSDTAYTITFINEGVETTQAACINYTFQLPVVTKEGYKFIGWSTVEDSTDCITTLNQITNTDITLYAVFVLSAYDITYDLNGGEWGDSEGTKAFIENQIVVLVDPVRDGYIFLGWYEGDIQITEINENRDYNLTAEWEQLLIKTTVTYEGNGGKITTHSSPDYSFYIQDFFRTDVLSQNTLGIHTGTTSSLLQSSDWSQYKGGYSKVAYRIFVKYDAETGLYVNVGYLQNVGAATAVTYDFDFAIVCFDPTSFAPVDDVIGASESTIISIYNYIKGNNKVYFDLGTNIPTSNNVGWRQEIKAYKTPYRSEDFVDNTIEYTESTTELPVLHKESYIFDGWYDNPCFTGKPVTEIVVDEYNKEINLYARWLGPIDWNSAEVVYNLNKGTYTGSGTVTSEYNNNTGKTEQIFAVETVRYDSGSLAIPTRAGYTFAGWYDVDGNRYTKAAELPGSIKLYAKWISDNNIIGSFETDSYVVQGEQITLHAEYAGGIDHTPNYVWSTNNENIATVIDGVVTGISAGVVIITVTDTANGDKSFTFYVTVLEESLTGIEALIVESNNAQLFTRDNLLVGVVGEKYKNENPDIGTSSDYWHYWYYADNVTESVSKLFFKDYQIIKNSNYVSAPGSSQSYGTFSSLGTSVEFITFHYAADIYNLNGEGIDTIGIDGEGYAEGGKRLTQYVNHNGERVTASWNYGTGNDGVFAFINEKYTAYHAGTGTTKLGWVASGVYQQADDPEPYSYNVTLGSDNYFYIFGRKTSIKNSTGGSRLNNMGLAIKIVNGQYYLSEAQYNSTYGYIGSKGGNYYSIGIESSCAKGSDLWLTWQYSAQLCADLLIRHNLDTTRLVGHHFWSGKPCPQPMLENEMEIWYMFLEMVRAERELMENYSNYTLTMHSDSQYIADNGRITSLPQYTECATYDVTYTVGGVSKTITLSTIIPGYDA